MAITLTREDDGLLKLVGLSSDSKPTTNVPTGSTFNETDTGKVFVFSGSSWLSATTGDLTPATDNTGNVGTDALRWQRIRGVQVVSGDYAWDDEECAKCRGAFKVGDDVVFRVHRVEPDEAGRRVSYAVPVHSNCRRAPC